MAKLLRSYEIPDELVDAIHRSYANTRANLYSPDGISKSLI